MIRGEEITVHLDDAAFEGKSVARIDDLVVFVHGGVPGDTVVARLTKIKKTFLEAETIRVLERSPDRVPARCIHFGICGGCKWQELSYPVQCAYKRQHVIDSLERIGGFAGVKVNECLPSPSVYLYRNKMEFSFGERWLTREEMTGTECSLFALGLHIPERFDKVLDLQECWLQSEVSARIVNATRRFALKHGLTIFSSRSHSGYLRNLVIRESQRSGEWMVNLVTREDSPEVMKLYCAELLAEIPDITTIINNVTDRKSQVALGEFENVYHGSGFIMDLIGKRRYRISANSFFQTNTEQAERLYDVVRRMAALTGTEVVYDLYCGTGTIALHLAEDARSIVGVESVPQAIADARMNADANAVTNCTFVLGDLKDILSAGSHMLEQHSHPDVIVVDPPRSGLHPQVAQQLRRMGAARIVYVSCNPATQARDLKTLTEEGYYCLKESQPVDMFPHTYHIENVAMLERATAAM